MGIRNRIKRFIVVILLKEVNKLKLLEALTGQDWEWSNPIDSSNTVQNIISSSIFKDSNGQAYDMDGLIFIEPNGFCYTNRYSRVNITFPYTPTKTYVYVPASDETIN